MNYEHQIVDLLIMMIQFKSRETKDHLARMQSYSKIILDYVANLPENPYQLTQTDIETIAQVSVLHDIGKIGVDDKHLNKTRHLNRRESAEMQRHVEHGLTIIEKCKPFFTEAALQHTRDICLYHHERVDGKGYPNGISGKDIPLSAQVVALADVYDALRSKRVYKKKFSHEEAMAMIKAGKTGAFSKTMMTALEHTALQLDQVYQDDEVNYN